MAKPRLRWPPSGTAPRTKRPRDEGRDGEREEAQAEGRPDGQGADSEGEQEGEARDESDVARLEGSAAGGEPLSGGGSIEAGSAYEHSS